MYSLRVELTDELHKVLHDYSLRHQSSMADVVRTQINALPVGFVSPASVVTDIKAHSRLFEKLVYWTRKRLSRGMLLVDKHIAIEEVTGYLLNLQECNTLEEMCVFFSHGALSRQERLCIAQFAPIWKISYEAWQKVKLHDPTVAWYDGFGPGEYCVLTEELLGGVGSNSVITRNQYDCQVLNAANMMIVDVDLKGDSIHDYDPVIASSASQAVNALKALCHQDESLGFNIYRTAAGLRYICTSKEFDPADYQSRRIMRQLYADPRYRNLCEFQETYRARLTPKPWRAVDGNCNTPEDAIESGYKTCQYLGHCGADVVADEFAPVIKLHDDATGARSEDKGLELA